MRTEWGSSGQGAALWANIVDYAFLLVYGAYMTVAIAAMRASALRREDPRLARLGTVLLPLPIVAAAIALAVGQARRLQLDPMATERARAGMSAVLGRRGRPR